jgi:hypothetical protein
MTADLAAQVAAHFGPEGVRRFTAAELTQAPVPPQAAEVLGAPGLPLQVGPYFTATTAEPLPLGEYAATVGFPDSAPESAQWCRLGTDHGAELCVGPAGDVQAVFVVADAPAMTVNTSVQAFIASLLLLDRHLPLLASPGEQRAVEVFRALRKGLLEVDAAAHEDDEAWWPRVLEEIRHALSFPFAAAFEYEDASGDKQVETEQARVGLPHPERVLWERLEAKGVAPDQVTRVYTELEPCFLPGNYCAMWLNRFRSAEFTYSFDYGATADEREQGILELMQQAANQG